MHDTPQSALAALAPYQRSPTFAFIDPDGLDHAKQQVTDLFGSTEWRPILDGRRSGALDAECTATS
ncbi:MAG: hypothetical protein ACRDSR_18755 [Pseudonocardiaceae bacterium]